MVMGMRERGGRVRFVHIDDGKLPSIRKAISENVHPQTKKVYHGLGSGL